MGCWGAAEHPKGADTLKATGRPVLLNEMARAVSLDGFKVF